MPTVDDALIYLGYDVVDDVIRKNVTRQLAAAIKELQGAVGDDVDTLMPDDERVHELVFIYLDDLHSNRGMSAKVSGAVRRSVQTLELQLTMELRRLREEAGA